MGLTDLSSVYFFLWLITHHMDACDFVMLDVCFHPSDADVSCEYGSNKYYLLCGFGGVLSCGLTHTAVVPLDLIKCRIQVFILLPSFNISVKTNKF